MPLLPLSRLARRDVKVVLSGEGSDEILAGYNFDQSEREFARLRVFSDFRKTRFGSVPHFLNSDFPKACSGKLKRWRMSRWWIGTRSRCRTSPGILARYEKQALWPGEEWRESTRIIAASTPRASASDDPLQQMLAVYQQSWLVEDLLMKADKTTMAASLEARTRSRLPSCRVGEPAAERCESEAGRV